MDAAVGTGCEGGGTVVTGVDHVIILVDDLGIVMQRYRALGFHVEIGGRHPGWGTENALLPLSDGAYIELLAASDRSLITGHRLWRRQDGSLREPGEYGGFMFGSTDLAADVSRIRGHGLAIDDPTAGSRLRPDGEEVRWRLAFGSRGDFPAIIQDETPRARRVPAASGLNERARLARVMVAVPNVEESARAYALMLESPTAAVHMTSRGREAEYPTAVGRVALVEAAGAGRGRDRGDASAPGVVSIELTLEGTPDSAPVLAASRPDQDGLRRIDPGMTGGAAIFLTGSA
jgi:hypothetical protein